MSTTAPLKTLLDFEKDDNLKTTTNVTFDEGLSRLELCAIDSDLEPFIIVEVEGRLFMVCPQRPGRSHVFPHIYVARKVEDELKKPVVRAFVSPSKMEVPLKLWVGVWDYERSVDVEDTGKTYNNSSPAEIALICNTTDYDPGILPIGANNSGLVLAKFERTEEGIWTMEGLFKQFLLETLDPGLILAQCGYQQSLRLPY